MIFKLKIKLKKQINKHETPNAKDTQVNNNKKKWQQNLFRCHLNAFFSIFNTEQLIEIIIYTYKKEKKTKYLLID